MNAISGVIEKPGPGTLSPDATLEALSLPLRPVGWRKLARYCGASLVGVVLSQAALAVAYGVFGADVPAAVAIALAVSLLPSYVLNQRLVWPAADGERRRHQLLGFLAVAFAGSVLTAVIGAATEALAHRVTSDRLSLTAVVVTSAGLTTVLVWLARYVVLDRLIFRVTP